VRRSRLPCSSKSKPLANSAKKSIAWQTFVEVEGC
jgi:hypothetical protein